VPSSFEITVGARSSPLSKKQVEEVYGELKALHPHVVFRPIYVETMGDRDRTTSLRTLDKTDFFTRDIDQMLLKKECRIAIHSAKDLPEPLPKGIVLAALTKGIDCSDSLVLRQNAPIPKGGVVATSSERREQSVRQLFPDVRFVDIRGNIQERLAKLTNGEVDGVVIAEAALIRLGLTHLNRLRLPGEAALLQGRLAVTVREGDHQMLELFYRLCTNFSGIPERSHDFPFKT
jgi:hydroxymethylbilane synthase